MGTVIITGSAHRLGAATAKLFHQNGWNVIVHYQTSEIRAQELVDQLNEQRPHSACCIQANLSKLDELEHLANKAKQAFGRINVLINNASTFYPTQVGDTSEGQWNDLFDVNLKAPYFLAQALRDELAKQHGAIINLADIHGLRPLKKHAVYSTAKAGLIAMTKALALELAPKIRVNAVAPGAILWPDQNDDVTEEHQQQTMQKIPLNRMGEEQNIAKAIWHLAVEADYVTGQVLPVDGGRTLHQ